VTTDTLKDNKDTTKMFNPLASMGTKIPSEVAKFVGPEVAGLI
jgi:hypothetical protein